MSKKLTISLVAVGIVVAVVLILFWTLFALSSVTVDFQSTLINLDVSAKEIVEAGDFHLGACVLFEGKKKSVQKIYDKARENPKFAYIRVVNIETVFPNKFVVHVAEREELFAVEKDGQVLICDRDFRVLDALESEDFSSNPKKVVLLENLEIKNGEIAVGDFLEIGQASMKNFYSSFARNNRTYGEIVGKFQTAKLSTYIEEVTNEEFDALTLSTFEGREFVIKNPDFALANKVALMFAVESLLFSQNVDENGNILDGNGQPIYLAKNAKGQYYVPDDEQPDTEEVAEKVALNFDILQNCQIVVDNLTLSKYVERTENDVYFYLQEKS